MMLDTFTRKRAIGPVQATIKVCTSSLMTSSFTATVSLQSGYVKQRRSNTRLTRTIKPR